MPPKGKSKLPASLGLYRKILPLLVIISKLSYLAEYFHHLSAKCSDEVEENMKKMIFTRMCSHISM
jgi:hypothetical protein